MALSDRKQEKREAILGAALRCFAERGFHGTTVPTIAEDAEVGAGTIYRYFENKEALVNALFKAWKTAITEALTSDFPWTAPPREQFHVFWSRAVQFGVDNPEAVQFLEAHHHASFLDEESKAIEDNIMVMARTWLEMTAHTQATKDMPAEVLALMIWGMVVAVVRGGWEGRYSVTPKLIELTESVAWEAVRR